MVNIQKEVEKYITNHPFIRISLFENLINYSKLSRKIIFELELNDNSLDAVIVACRRIYDKFSRQVKNKQAPIKDILESTSLNIRNKISVVILSSNTPEEKLGMFRVDVEKKNKKFNQKEVMHIIRGATAVTVITSEENANRMNKTFNRYVVKKTDNLVEVIMKSSTLLEDIPGVIAHLYSILAENGINVIETMSCWTDTILVLKQKDLGRVINLLSF